MTRLQFGRYLPETSYTQENRVFEAIPRFPKSDVFRYLGGSDGQLGSRHSVRKVKKWTKEITGLVNPRLVYSVQGIDNVEKTRITLEDGTVFRTAKLAAAMQDCEYAVCFVGTLGGEIEEVIESLTDKNKYSDAFVVDALGSVGAEYLVDRFHKQMELHLKKLAKGVSLRFSPGYCDWTVKEQKELFRQVDSTLVDVELTDSSLMNPRKSVSGVFGINTTGKAVSRPINPCIECKKSNCAVRRNR
jgi:hypothetical protein